MINFSDKVALVTGGTRGIGLNIVNLLNSLDCKVIYTGTNQEVHGTNNNGSKVFLQLDLSQEQSINHFFDKLISIPKIDILVNNAGINVIESIDAINNEIWEKILQVNLTGAMLMMKEVSKKMKTNKSGKILNVSSIFGVVSKEKRNAYSASKSGLIGLTRASALDLAPYNILVNALCPGFTMTDLTKSILLDDEIKRLSVDIPLGRFAKEEEIARIAAFLCSDANTYITGQTIIVDGGYTIR